MGTIIMTMMKTGDDDGDDDDDDDVDEKGDIFLSAAICQTPCQNGGTCDTPDHCACPPGYSGAFCQTRESALAS